MHSIKFLGLTLGIALSIFAISLAVYAWTAPTAAPPDGNVPAPINVGTTTQTKAGALGVGGVFTANSAVHLAVGGGNVGIGTTAPGALLHVADLFAAGGRNLQIGDDTFLSDIDLTNTLGLYGIQDSTRGNIRLGSAGPIISGVGGNVGIGTTAPGARLHVEGNIIAAAPTAYNHVATRGWVEANTTGNAPSMYLTANTRTGDHNCDDNPGFCCAPNYSLCYKIEMIGRHIERTGTNRHANPGLLWGDVRLDHNGQHDCRGWTTQVQDWTNYRHTAILTVDTPCGVTSTWRGHWCETRNHQWCCSN